MIVSVVCPSNITQVRYGAAGMIPNPDHTLDVPDYVAKSICTLPGFSCVANLSNTALQLLNAGPQADNWEAGYVLRGYGKPVTGIPDDDFTAGKALLTANGEPAVSAS